MFTTVVDNAAARFKFANGVEVAFGYDECPMNPIEDWDIFPVGIESTDAGTITTDPHDFMKDYDALYEAYLDELEDEYGDNLSEAKRIAKQRLADEHGLHEYVLRAHDLWGWPEYRVVVSSAELEKLGIDPTPKTILNCAGDAVNEYARWCAGEVYVVGVDTGSEVDYISGIYADPSEAQARWMAKYDFGIDLEGVELV